MVEHPTGARRATYLEDMTLTSSRSVGDKSSDIVVLPAVNSAPPILPHKRTQP